MQFESESESCSRRSNRLRLLTEMSKIHEETQADNEQTNTSESIQNLIAPLLKRLDKLEQKLLPPANMEQEQNEPDYPPLQSNTKREIVILTVKPTFNGIEMHPIKFLKELETYLKHINAPNDLVATLDCLVEDAKDWSEMLADEWNNYEDFKKDFMDKYWGREIQNKIKRALQVGRWNPRGKKTMSDYFSWKYCEAKRLTNFIYNCNNNITDEIMQHFPQEIKSLWAVTDTKGPVAALRFLTKLESTIECNARTRYFHTPGKTKCRNIAMGNKNIHRQTMVAESTFVGIETVPTNVGIETIPNNCSMK